MDPVLDQNNKPLFPCKERRARALMQRKEAIAYWQKGIFCIKLIRQETEKREEYPAIALGIDPGSKREGYTVATAKGVILNITSNTPHWVKAHVETRRNLRRSRRQRKTPYRKCRPNRSTLREENRIAPSTKARWDAKLRISKQLRKIIPITIVNIEDIQAVAKKGKKIWNVSFSPLEVGKAYFYAEMQKLIPNLIKTQGFDTKLHRDKRGFKKSKDKLAYIWDAHNVDSHSLAEIALTTNVVPYLGLWKIEFMQFFRRQLHVQIPAKKNIRKQYGGTVSMSMSRGSILRYKNKLCYLGGTSKSKVAIYSIIDGNRVNQYVNTADISLMHMTKYRIQFCTQINAWASLKNFL